MSARVLIVDDLAPNVKLLEAKLASEYYDYASAYSGKEALEKVKSFVPDIILLDVMMPEMDGFEACRRLKADPQTNFIPVLMVTALSDMQDRVKGLESGADDFITKPINEVHLFARIKSLVRTKLMQDELRLRDKTGAQFGLLEQMGQADTDPRRAKIYVVNDDVVESRQIVDKLSPMNVEVKSISAENANNAENLRDADLLIVSTELDNADGLRLCMHLRSQEITRQLSMVILVNEDDRPLLIKGLEMGINDYLMTPIDSNELIARVRNQLRRKRYQDALRANHENNLSLAISDGLTKLYNRRYLDAHLQTIVAEAKNKNGYLSLLTIDIDHFKSVNDHPGWGHHIGDEILKQVAERILNNIRNTDLAARLGGEEFVLVMPGASSEIAKQVAERLRASIETVPFTISADPGTVQVTASIGLASLSQDINTPQAIMQASDKALYEAKRSGRNRVITHAA